MMGTVMLADMLPETEVINCMSAAIFAMAMPGI